MQMVANTRKAVVAAVVVAVAEPAPVVTVMWLVVAVDVAAVDGGAGTGIDGTAYFEGHR